MKKLLLDNKLKNLLNTINMLLLNSGDSIDEVHLLRKKARELLSLVSISDSFYPKLKKIIKLSNTIRDIDVFFSTYLESLKPAYKKSLHINRLIINEKKRRDKLFLQLYLYLENLNIPLNVKYQDMTHLLSFQKDEKKEPLLFEQKALHKYRIDIKHTLYSLKNHKKKEKKKIKVLTALKDLLGKINDNFNGLDRLKKLQAIEAKLLKKIEKYTIKQNMKYFNKVKKLNNSL